MKHAVEQAGEIVDPTENSCVHGVEDRSINKLPISPRVETQQKCTNYTHLLLLKKLINCSLTFCNFISRDLFAQTRESRNYALFFIYLYSVFISTMCLNNENV